MSRLDGKVAIVTGAGRGLGRAHALALAKEGAAVVVNDLGGDVHGEGLDTTPAKETVALIEEQGGRAVVSGHDVADWASAAEMITMATETFGGLDVLVNNAGILRDRTLSNMEEAEWDAVIRVHLKGHAAPTRHAVAYWKEQARAGQPVAGSVVMTSSASGLVGNFGQANYGSAKLAVLALSSVVNLEYGRYGVRSNVIAPAASTRMGATIPANEAQEEPAGMEPERISPLVVWLADPRCPAANQVFQVHGRRIIVLQSPTIAADLTTDGWWSLDELDERLTPALVKPLVLADLFSPDDVATS